MSVPAIHYLAFWGKAQPAQAAPAPQWHPAAFHLLDVAAAADALLRARPLAAARGAGLLGLAPDAAHDLIVALAALHDLGKFGAAFQAKVEARWPAHVLGPYRSAAAGRAHTVDGHSLWSGGLGAPVGAALWPAGVHVLDALAAAVFGHHGRPVAADRGLVADLLGAASVAAARACAADVLALLHPEPVAVPFMGGDAARASWWLSGLLTVADWVGSQQQHFAYTLPDPALLPADALAAYWPLAKERAAAALREAGLVPAPAAPRRGFADLTGITLAPSPVQAWAAEVELPPGPVLVLVEDVTGAGKTEAAQVLVHRLMAEGRATGAFWAMPTQATANAMYARQDGAIRGLFADGARPSLVLAHGQARLHEGFRATVLGASPRSGGDAVAPPALRGRGDAELPSSAACAAFLADDRRAALLADVGAGTVDQAVLGVLASRFNTVRLFGLADKILVLDEAHAYDPYLAEEVATLLRFHASLGGSAVVLSATLTRAQWDALVGAWRGVAGGADVARLSAWKRPAAVVETQPAREDGYPLVTVVSHARGVDGVRQVALGAADWSRRRVGVRFARSAEAALDALVAAHAAGGAAAWVRNTVDECLWAAAALRARGIEPMVFHARFAQGDRQRREREVLAAFGKPRGVAPEDEHHRRGRVLVATQVIEQSLDLDFDVLVSDLAPVDLLVQRAGRLWRHPARDAWRTARGFERDLVVLAPEALDEPEANWPAPLLPKVRRIYARVDVLWRTARVLEDAGAIATPGESGDPAALRALIAAVYDAPRDTPDVLQAAADRAEIEQKAQRATAVYATLKPADGYNAHAAEWQNDLHAPTRLGDQQVVVRIARVDGGMLRPWCGDDPGAPAWKQWALSEVKLAAWRVPAGAHAGPEFDAAVAAVRAEWGRFEQELPVLPLREVGSGVWEGALLRPGAGPTAVRYTAGEGVRYA